MDSPEQSTALDPIFERLSGPAQNILRGISRSGGESSLEFISETQNVPEPKIEELLGPVVDLGILKRYQIIENGPGVRSELVEDLNGEVYMLVPEWNDYMQKKRENSFRS